MEMINTSGVYPIRDLILVKSEEDVSSYKGTIIIPQGAEEKERMAQIYGLIVAMGQTCYAFEREQYKIEMGIKPGDRVQFAKYQGLVIKGKDGIQYRMLRDDDIMAKVDNDVKKEVES